MLSSVKRTIRMRDDGETTFFSMRMRDDGEMTIFIPILRYLTRYLVMTWVMGICGGLIIGYVAVIDGGLASVPNVFLKTDDQMKEMKHFVNFFLPIAIVFIVVVYDSITKKDTDDSGISVLLILGGIFFDWVWTKPYMSRRIYDFALHMGRGLIYVAFRYAFELPIYMCEMAPSGCHDFLILSFQLMIPMGIFLGHLVNYNIGSHWCIFLVFIPASIMSIGYFRLPHTPIYMIEKGESGKARGILSLIHGMKNIYEVDNKFFNLVQSHADEKGSTIHPQPCMMVLLIALLQQLTGAANVILFYGPSAFEAIGFDTNASLMAGVLLGGVNVVAYFVFVFIGDRRPTKFKLKTGLILMFVCQIIIGILALISIKEHGNSIILATCIYIACYVWSWGSVWLVPNEIFRTLKIPLAIQWSQNASANLLTNTIMSFVFLSMSHSLKFSIYCVIFSFVVLIMFVVFFLPENNGLSVKETSIVWKQHWFWRIFFTNNGGGCGLGGGSGKDDHDGGEGGVGGNGDNDVIFGQEPTLYYRNISYNIRF